MIEAVQLPQSKKFNFFHSIFYLQSGQVLYEVTFELLLQGAIHKLRLHEEVSR